MDYHVSTPAETALVMQTEDGRVVQVLPAPPSSLPGDWPLGEMSGTADYRQTMSEMP
jgi:hypothetical protein